MSESGGDDFYYDDTADFTPDAWQLGRRRRQHPILRRRRGLFPVCRQRRLLRSRLRREPFRLDAGKRLRKHLGQLQHLVLLRHRQLRQHRLQLPNGRRLDHRHGQRQFLLRRLRQLLLLRQRRHDERHGLGKRGRATATTSASRWTPAATGIRPRSAEAKAAATTPTAATPAAEPTARKSVWRPSAAAPSPRPSTVLRKRQHVAKRQRRLDRDLLPDRLGRQLHGRLVPVRQRLRIGSGAANFSYSANSSSGSYTDASDLSSVSAAASGSHNTSYSESDGWTWPAEHGARRTSTTSSSASAHDNWQYAASGDWSTAASNGDPNALGDWSYSNAAGSYSDSVQQSTSSAAYQETNCGAARALPRTQGPRRSPAARPIPPSWPATTTATGPTASATSQQLRPGQPNSRPPTTTTVTARPIGRRATELPPSPGRATPPTRPAADQFRRQLLRHFTYSASDYGEPSRAQPAPTAPPPPPTRRRPDHRSRLRLRGLLHRSRFLRPGRRDRPRLIFSDDWYESTPATASNAMAAGRTAACATGSARAVGCAH